MALANKLPASADGEYLKSQQIRAAGANSTFAGQKAYSGGRCGRDRIGAGGVRDDVFAAVDRYFQHREALAHFDTAADSYQVAVGGLAHEVDVQAGGDRELDCAELAQHHGVHADIGQHHHERPGDCAAGAYRMIAVGQNHLGLAGFDAAQVNARIRGRGQFAGDDRIEGFDTDFTHGM